MASSSLPRARLFSPVAKSFPKRVRHEIETLEYFVHTARAIVDTPHGKSSHEQRLAVEDYRRKTIEAIRDPATTTDHALLAFVRVVREHTIPDLEVHALFDAIAADAYKKTYKDIAELEQYLRGSAGALSTMFLAIVGYTGERDTVKRHTRSLMNALVLTNMLDTLDADFHARGRVYLPQTIIAKHSTSLEEIKKRKMTPGLRKALHEIAVWTRNLYHEGVSGIHFLAKDVRLGVLLATIHGLETLNRIEHEGYNVFLPRRGHGVFMRSRLAMRVRLEYVTFKRSELAVCRLTHAL